MRVFRSIKKFFEIFPTFIILNKCNDRENPAEIIFHYFKEISISLKFFVAPKNFSVHKLKINKFIFLCSFINLKREKEKNF